MTNFSLDVFPSGKSLRQMRLAPILLRPILGSPEQLVVGTIATDEKEYFIARANRLDRLDCLFPNACDHLLAVIDHSCQSISMHLQSTLAIENTPQIYSGITVGEVRIVEGRSLRDAANHWLCTLSSLHEDLLDGSATTMTREALTSFSSTSDRLPSLIYDYVLSRREGLAKYFDLEIREKTKRRRAEPTSVLIDYAGSRLVANFGTLTPAGYSASVDRLKRRLWDLQIFRDSEIASIGSRQTHQLIIQHPNVDDPQIQERQYARILDGVQRLREQATKEEIAISAMHSVGEIAEHLVALEDAT